MYSWYLVEKILASRNDLTFKMIYLLSVVAVLRRESVLRGLIVSIWLGRISITASGLCLAPIIKVFNRPQNSTVIGRFVCT